MALALQRPVADNFYRLHRLFSLGGSELSPGLLEKTGLPRFPERARDRLAPRAAPYRYRHVSSACACYKQLPDKWKVLDLFQAFRRSTQNSCEPR
jgi:hypothetical protein